MIQELISINPVRIVDFQETINLLFVVNKIKIRKNLLYSKNF